MEPFRAPLSLPADVLERYLAGEATVEETGQVDTWVAGHPDRGRVIERLARVRTSEPAAAWEVDRVWNALDARIGGEATPVSDAIVPHSDSPVTRLSRRVAGLRRRVPTASGHMWIQRVAAMATVVTLGIALFVFVRAPGVGSDAVREYTYATRAGQRAAIALADGSHVTLAPGTMLRVRGRDLTLAGHAYFDVVRDPSHPFVVHTAGVTTRVLGTSFDVRRYPGDRTTRVAVLSGRVLVSATERTAALHVLPAAALDAGMIADATDSSVTSGVVDDVAHLSAWRDGQLVFRDDSVADVLTTLGHWFGVRFELSDSSLAAQHITAMCDGRSLSDALMVLGTTLDVTSTIRDTVVTLRVGRAAHSERPAPRHRGRDLMSQPREVGR